MKIRQAKAMDGFFLLQMMKDYLKETSAKYPPVDESDCIDWILSVIRSQGVWVAIVDKQIVGTIGCSVSPFPWNKKRFLVGNEWLYVKPEHRKSRIAVSLLNEAKSAAKAAGFPFVFHTSSGKKALGRLLRMQGFEDMGGTGIYWGENSDE